MSNPEERPKQEKLVVSSEQKKFAATAAATAEFRDRWPFRARNHSGVCQWTEQRCGGPPSLHNTGFTVGMWRNRFTHRGLAGLGDEMRQERPDQMAMTALNGPYAYLEEVPKGARIGAVRALAARDGFESIPR